MIKRNKMIHYRNLIITLSVVIPVIIVLIIVIVLLTQKKATTPLSPLCSPSFVSPSTSTTKQSIDKQTKQSNDKHESPNMFDETSHSEQTISTDEHVFYLTLLNKEQIHTILVLQVFNSIEILNSDIFGDITVDIKSQNQEQIVLETKWESHPLNIQFESDVTTRIYTKYPELENLDAISILDVQQKIIEKDCQIFLEDDSDSELTKILSVNLTSDTLILLLVYNNYCQLYSITDKTIFTAVSRPFFIGYEPTDLYLIGNGKEFIVVGIYAKLVQLYNGTTGKQSILTKAYENCNMFASLGAQNKLVIALLNRDKSSSPLSVAVFDDAFSDQKTTVQTTVDFVQNIQNIQNIAYVQIRCCADDFLLAITDTKLISLQIRDNQIVKQQDIISGSITNLQTFTLDNISMIFYIDEKGSLMGSKMTNTAVWTTPFIVIQHIAQQYSLLGDQNGCKLVYILGSKIFFYRVPFKSLKLKLM